MSRMGPAFERSKLGGLVFLFGLFLALFPPGGLMGPEAAASESLRATLSWAIPGALGLFIAASGAPIYYVSNFPRLILGWILSLYSLSVMIVEWNPNTGMLATTASSAAGVSVTVLIYLYSIRLTESMGQGDGVTKPLEDDEIEHVSKILLANLDEGGLQ